MIANRFLLAALLAGGGISTFLFAQPKPEPVPQEVIDGNAIRKQCKGRGPAITEAEMACIEGMVARMPKLDPAKRELFGAHYDPQAYARCLGRKARVWELGCEYLILQRHPAPEYWPNPDAPKPSVPAPDLGKYYRPGIGQKEYFDALCKNVAGEFILKSVDNVESIYQIRPRRAADDDSLEDPYVLEDPYGYTRAEGENELWTTLLSKGRYRFAEAAVVLSHKSFGIATEFVRFSKPDFSKIGPQADPINRIQSHYGYTWREIDAPRERALGIAGGDLIVVDLRTGEVLGFKRGFSRSIVTTRTVGGRNWRATDNCPMYDVTDGRTTKDFDMVYWFVKKVLKPTGQRGS